MSVEIRDFFLYLLYYIQPAIARTSSSAGFLDFFFPPFDENNGMQKKKKKSFGKGAGQISSNCLVIGKWFSFLTIFLAGWEQGRCGVVGTASSWPDVRWDRGGGSLLAGLWSASHLCSFHPPDLWPGINPERPFTLACSLGPALAGRPAFPWDYRWLLEAPYTCFSWCTMHLAARQDLQFHPPQGAEQGLGRWGGGWQPERLPFACALLFRGSSGINYHLMATPGPRPFACLSCEKDLEEPTYGFDRSNCRLIEWMQGWGGWVSLPALSTLGC